MKVRAISRGVYGRIVEQGQTFDIASDDHLGSWMEPVDAKDRDRLADRLKAFNADRRAPARPDVPLTTGPGVPNALRDPIQPKAEPPKAEPKADKPKPEPAPKADKG